MKHLITFNGLNEEKSIKDLSVDKERPMVEGIAEMLKMVRDRGNRREIAESQIEEFKREGIQFDYNEFLKLCGL